MERHRADHATAYSKRLTKQVKATAGNAAGGCPGSFTEATARSATSPSARPIWRLLRGNHRQAALIGLEIDGAAAEPVLVTELQWTSVARAASRGFHPRGPPG